MVMVPMSALLADPAAPHGTVSSPTLRAFMDDVLVAAAWVDDANLEQVQNASAPLLLRKPSYPSAKKRVERDHLAFTEASCPTAQ